MPTVHFTLPDGSPAGVDAPEGSTAMQAATGAGLPGIVGECGGSAMCATCHVYVDPAWTDRTGPAPEGIEADMLAVTDGAAPNSRLACQIRLDGTLDGLMLHMPPTQ